MAEHKLIGEEQGAVIRGIASMPDSLTPGRAIRKICIDCVGSAFEISDCQVPDEISIFYYPHFAGSLWVSIAESSFQ